VAGPKGAPMDHRRGPTGVGGTHSTRRRVIRAAVYNI
jgi:hypothetical protein